MENKMVVVIKPIDTLNGTVDYICSELRKCIHLQPNKEAKINLSLDLTRPEYILVKKEEKILRYHLKWFKGKSFSSFYASIDERKMVNHVREMVLTMSELCKREQFEQKCYEAYQLDWMMSHGYSLDKLYRLMLEYEKEMFDPADFRDSDGDLSYEHEFKKEDLERSAMQARDTFLYELGFGDGNVYACKNEFLDHEYLDKDYMYGLFDRMPDSNSLKKQYEDICRMEGIA